MAFHARFGRFARAARRRLLAAEAAHPDSPELAALHRTLNGAVDAYCDEFDKVPADILAVPAGESAADDPSLDSGGDGKD